jgi:ABC-type polysaccharide/polyol phosphate export permease
LGTAANVALRDLLGSVLRLPLAFSLAVDDINGRYRRTVLGPFWLIVGQAATIAGFVVVFSGLFNQDPTTYALYLAAGFPVWLMISQYLVDMPLTFIQARGFIETFELPWLVHIWRRSINYVLVFLHQLVALFALFLIMRIPFKFEQLLVLPALVVLMVAGSGVGLLLAVINARYRDLQPAMSVLAGFLFLFSPVVWRPEQLHLNEWAVRFNPMHYYIKLVRDPLMGVAPSAELWIGASLGAVALFGLGFLAFFFARRRLYYWL